MRVISWEKSAKSSNKHVMIRKKSANSRIFNALGAARAVYYCLFNVPESSGKAIIGRLAGFKRVAKPIRNRAGATPPKVADLKPWLILLGPRKIEGVEGVEAKR